MWGMPKTQCYSSYTKLISLSDPSRLVLESISLRTPFIAIDLNYRLNVFGFAASSELLDRQVGDQRQGCNFGLRDQHVGIRWVSKNISHFGGDPMKITIGGQSAGAASVHAQTLSAKLGPHGKALFRRSIMQSGALGSLGPSPLGDANRNWERLCKVFGFEADDPISRTERLRTLPPEELVRAQRELGWWAYNVTIDNKLVTSTDIGYDVLVNFGEEGDLDVNSRTTSSDAIEVLIGDTETEVILGVPRSVSKADMRLIGELVCARGSQNCPFTRSRKYISRSVSFHFSCECYSGSVRNEPRDFIGTATPTALLFCWRHDVRVPNISSSRNLLKLANQPER